LSSGYYSEKNASDRPGSEISQQHDSIPCSETPQLPPDITMTPAQTSYPETVQQSAVPLPSISERDRSDSIAILDGTELPAKEKSVSTPEGRVNQQQGGQDDKAASRPMVQGECAGLSRGSPEPSIELSPASSNTTSYGNPISPVSAVEERDSVARDGIVMRSNLNVSRNRRARQGSAAKHVMSFMEYETENESVGSGSRRSSLRVGGKGPVMGGDQGRGLDQAESPRRR
jgi:hypothetical protein